MKNRKHTFKGFCIGLLTAAVIVGTGLPAMALSNFQQINVAMGGIKLFVDGKLQVPTDVKGNVVEPLIYNGTTYLPVRALTGMLTDKSVEWDAKTESVYIGIKPGAGEVIRADTMHPYDSSSSYVAYAGKDAQFDLLNETKTPFNRYKMGYTVQLDGMYTELNGEFVIPRYNLTSRSAGKLCIYSVDQYGVKSLIDSYELRAGDDPVSVHTNIRGCGYLYVDVEKANLGDWSGSSGVFYNVTFTTATAK